MTGRFSPQRLPPVERWRIHVGAHKTATTHLQNSLELHREALAETGLDYIPRGMFRETRLKLRKGPLGWRMWFGGSAMRHRISRRLAGCRTGPATVVVSEESLIGYPKDLLAEAYYPSAHRRLEALSALGHGGRLDIFLSIRSPEKILPSAYSQAIRVAPHPERFEVIAERALRRPPRWSELLTRLRETLPGVRLHVWTFEDYVRQPRDFMAAFCGAEMPLQDALSAPMRTQSLSGETIARMEQLDPSMDLDAYRSAAAAISGADDRTQKYAPFSDPQKQILAEAYAEDLDRIEKLFPGMILKPSEPAKP